ncbi:MAG: flagellar protein FliS [Planctomycetota bacterium]
MPSGFQNPTNFGSAPKHSGNVRVDKGQQYLDSLVRTSTPAQLRLLLIERSIEIAGNLATTWRTGNEPGKNGQSLMLLDFLSELLSGVTGSDEKQENKTCQRVADLYVFLSQHLVRAEERSDADAIDEISLVLQAEAETWRAVVAQSKTGELRQSSTPSTSPRQVAQRSSVSEHKPLDISG